MTHNELKNTTDLFEEIVDIFPECACKCFDIFFQKPCSPSAPWKVTDDIDCNTDRIITIGCANNAFQAISAIGINNADCRLLINDDLPDDDFLSLFGEVANTFIALLMDQEEFISRFGILNQSVPVLYSKGMPFLPFISGISGAISVEDRITIKIGFSMNHRLFLKKD